MLLTEEEKSALGAAIALPEDDARARALARPHQLVQPGADGKAALELADRVAGSAAKAVNIALVSETRIPWEVQPAAAELVSQLAPRAAGAGVALTVSTEHGPGALLLGPGLAQALVRAVLGVSIDAADGLAPAPLGVAERPVVTRLMRVFAREMGARIVAEGGASLYPGELVEDPLRLAGLKGPLLSVPLRFAAPIEGTLDLLLPLQVAGHIAATAGNRRVADHIPHIELDVVAELGHATICLADLAQLRPGMELKLDSYESALLQVKIDGKPRFLGKPMSSEGRLVLQIALKDRKPPPMKAPKEIAPRSG